MKILLTDLGNAVNAQGGIEKVVCNMANAFVERGHDVTLMIFDKRNGSMAFPLDVRVKFLNPGAGVHINRTLVNITNLFRRDKWEREMARYKCTVGRIAKIIAPIIDDINPDVIIGHELKSTIVLCDYIKEHALYISMLHFDPKTIFASPNFGHCYEKADDIVVLLDSFAEQIRKIIKPKHIDVIPNVVPQYDECANYSAKTIINVARIERKQKRQMDIVEAFNKIKDEFSDWHVEFWGDIDFDKKYYEELQQKIKEYGLENKIVFSGRTDRVSEKLQQASIFVFPSSYEGFPLALTEAMSMGLPAVGYKTCTAVNEIIKDGENGYLCEFTIEDLTDKLRLLMSDIELREQLGGQAKKDMKQYSENKIWNEWEKLLCKVVC